MNKLTIILFIFIILTLSIQDVFADTGFFEPCSGNPYSMFYSDLSNKIYVGCAGGELLLELCIVDPYSVTIDNSFAMDGLIESVYPIDYGLSLLLLLSDVDGNAYTEDGELRQISSSSGSTEHQYFFSTIPLSLSVDSAEDYAFITSGLDSHSIVPVINKINLGTWMKNLDDYPYGFYSIDSSLNIDNSKLYVRNQSVHISEQDEYYYELGVINTLYMTSYPSICLDSCASFLQMGYDNRLFVTHAVPGETQDNLSIIDTIDDTCCSMSFGNIGFEDIALDSVNYKLYCSVLTPQIDPELGELVFMPSNLVYEIDLENQYSYRIIQIAPEPVVQIEVVPLADLDYSCRIFGMSESSGKIFYYDVD